MQRTMFSGGSTPSARLQRRKNLQGISSCLQLRSKYEYEEIEWSIPGAYLEPDNNEVPEADHAELEWRIAHPCAAPTLVLDCDDVHRVQDELHCYEAYHPASSVARERAAWDAGRREELGDERVVSQQWAGEVEGWVQGIGEVEAEGVEGGRMRGRHARAVSRRRGQLVTIM